MHSQPWPWSTVRLPSAADWGSSMTVCLVGHSFPQNTFVAVVDSMLSTVDMSADRLAIKSFAVAPHWNAMFSANDLSPVMAVRELMRSRFNGPVSLDAVIAEFQKAFQKELIAKAETSILAPFAMTVDEFKKNGLAQFGAEIFARLFYQIEQISLDMTFLVYGFDEKSRPHIFTIQNRGEIARYDQPAFWAVGSGQTSALGTLFSATRSVNILSPPELLYLLCKAKFSAESALGVGQNTTAMISKPDGTRVVLFNEELSSLKNFWTMHKPVDIPVGGEKLAESAVAEAKLRIGKQEQQSETQKAVGGKGKATSP
jgi:hypothetical protein